MNEVIASILDAEKKADYIIKNSVEKSKLIKQTADIEGENVKNSAIAVFKLHRSSVLKNAENKAEEEYAAILSAGEKEAEQIKSKVAGEINVYAEEAVKNILKGI